MNTVDLVLTYRPLATDIEADWASDQRAQMLSRVLASSNSERVSRKLTTTARRPWLVPSLAVVGVAAALVASLSGSPSQPRDAEARGAPSAFVSTPVSSGTVARPEGVKLVFAGYQIALPASYKIGKSAVTADTNCTADLHLSAEQTDRVITTPTSGCPLLVTSVRRSLPAGAFYAPFSVCMQGQTAAGSAVLKAGYVGGYALKTDTYNFYVPAKLPDGSTVYVSIDLGATWGEGLNSGPACGTMTTQLAELAKGMKVAPTS